MTNLDRHRIKVSDLTQLRKSTAFKDYVVSWAHLMTLATDGSPISAPRAWSWYTTMAVDYTINGAGWTRMNGRS